MTEGIFCIKIPFMLERAELKLGKYIKNMNLVRDQEIAELLSEKARLASTSENLTTEEILSAASDINSRKMNTEDRLKQINRKFDEIAQIVGRFNFELPPEEVYYDEFNSEKQSYLDQEPKIVYPLNIFEEPQGEDLVKFAEDIIGFSEDSNNGEYKLENENYGEFCRKLVNVGLYNNRRVKILDTENTRQRQKGLVCFNVSEITPHLTIDNVLALRHNLGRFSSFMSIEADLLETNVQDLDLSSHTENCLNRSQIRTVEEIVSLTENQLSGLRNFGATGFHELIISLAYKGIIPNISSEVDDEDSLSVS